MDESNSLLNSLGVDLHGLDAVYLHVIEIIGAIRNYSNQYYISTDLEKAKLHIFWKTIREIADQYIKDDRIITNEAISTVMDTFPDKRKKTDGRIWLPMHFAMSIPDIDLDDIQILFDNHPDFITQGCDHDSNYTPCHLAVMMKDPDMNLIEMLKEFDPDFGVRQTRYETTPLHLAAEFSNSIPVIQELIREFPAALYMRDEDQKVPLARAFRNDSVDAPVIFRILLDAAPKTVNEPDNHGQFLLHQCLNYTSQDIPGREEMTSIMLEAFPNAVNFADNDGWLPIQLAALTCRTEVLIMITEVNPAHLSSSHPMWGTVAHMAAGGFNVRHGLVNLLHYIHSIKPELLLSLNRDNHTPLAIAVQHNSEIPEIVEKIVSLEPAAAIIVDINGDNLLHMMIKNPTRRVAHCKLLKLFLRLIPGGALATNNQGQTPYDFLDADDPDHVLFRRLLLLAGAPSLHPETRKQMNYQARKGALFAFFAPRGQHHSGGADICHRILHGAGAMEIVREIFSFL